MPFDANPYDDAYQTGYTVGLHDGTLTARLWWRAGPWLVLALVASMFANILFLI